LASSEKTEYEGIRTFAFSGEAATWLALHKYGADAPASDAGAGARPGAPAIGAGRRASGIEKPAGADLILRELATETELTLGNVSEFRFNKPGTALAILISTRDQHGNGVQLRNMQTGALVALDTGKADYQKLSWTERGDGLAVLKGIEEAGYEDKFHSVLG